MKVKLLHPLALAPARGTEGSAGYDLYSVEDVLIKPGQSEVVSTGISVEIPPGKFGLLTHRSSLAFKWSTIASLGVIDSDYRGEVKILLFNLGMEEVRFERGDKVAQLLILNHHKGAVIVSKGLSETVRGEGGFGSTGN